MNRRWSCWRSLHVLLWLAVCVSRQASAVEAAPERVLWNKTPISVHLEIAAERRVQFPARVKAGLPAAAANRLQILAVDDSLYLLAIGPLRERLVVQELDSGRTYLLDVVASEREVARSPVIVMAETAQGGENGPHAALPASGGDPRSPPDFVTLTRYAAQQVYAPRRLLRERSDIGRVPLHMDAPVPLIRGGEVEALPLASWRSRDHYVTAIRLQNLTDHVVAFDILDPRAQLRGRWETASFHHRQLRRRGEPGDTSALYLISVRAFEESLDGPPPAPPHSAAAPTFP